MGPQLCGGYRMYRRYAWHFGRHLATQCLRTTSGDCEGGNHRGRAVSTSFGVQNQIDMRTQCR